MKEPKLNFRLCAAREQRIWTLEEAAEKVGIDPQTFWRWENYVQRPRQYALRKLCQVFEMSAAELGFGKSADEVSQVPSGVKLEEDEMVSQMGGQSSEEITRELVSVSSFEEERVAFEVSRLTKPNLFDIGMKALELFQKQHGWSYGELLAYIEPAIRRLTMSKNQESNSITRRDALDLTPCRVVCNNNR